MFLVNSQRLWATIKCFAASGNRFPPAPIPTKRAAAMPQPSLGRSVVDMCRPIWLVRDASPLKLVAQPFVGRHGIVKGENDDPGKMFLFFPMRMIRCIPSLIWRQGSALPFFPDVLITTGTKAGAVHYVGGWRPPSATHCPAGGVADPLTEPLPLEQPVRSLAGRQFMPISTAIRIRSEWFLAPSFCLSREVVLATVL